LGCYSLLAGLRASISLCVKRIIIKGDSQLIVNFSNKAYKPKDSHMIAYIEEVRKLEKRFLRMDMVYIPRSENQEADDIAKRASRREAQPPCVFEERLFQPSATLPNDDNSSNTKQLPPPPTSDAPGCPAGDHLLLALEPQDASWIVELKDFLTTRTLPEDDTEAERVA
jgi:hypothetical protein